MPKYYSNLKHVYKKMYDELTNKKSPIGIFLSTVGHNSALDNAKEIKVAVKEYIALYEEEVKNFVEPPEDEMTLDYVEETKRLQHNAEVQKKLEAAIDKMNQAMDLFAEKEKGSPAQPTEAEIAEMKDFYAKREAQKKRILNAAYNIEVQMEEEMINKLKGEYKLFDHRPLESKIEPPPVVKESAPYIFRHKTELRGGADVPTSVYGLFRFRDLLGEHENMLNEEERSRSYHKFVNDRLAGFKAWKLTQKRETELFDEIRGKVDPDYFAEYDKFMKEYPGTSSAAGYTVWFNQTRENVEKWRDEINKLQSEQDQLDGAVTNLEGEYQELLAGQEIKRISLEEGIKTAESDERLTQEYADKNNEARTQAQKNIEDLENELNQIDIDMQELDNQHNGIKNIVSENARTLQNYTIELEKLQKALEKGENAALEDFLKNHEAVAKNMDETLQQQKSDLEDFTKIEGELKKHNDNIQKTEGEIRGYQDRVNEARTQLNILNEAYNEAKKKAADDLKNEKTFLAGLARTFTWGETRQRNKAKLEFAETQNEDVQNYQQIVDELNFNVETNEKHLNDSKTQLDSYKNALKSTQEHLTNKIKESIESSRELQQNLHHLHEEVENATLEHENKLKELEKESTDKKLTYKNILEKTSKEIDEILDKKRQKEERKQKIKEAIENAKNTIENCTEVDKGIEQAKAAKDAAHKAKAEFEATIPRDREKLQTEINEAKERADYARVDLNAAKEKHQKKIESHDVLKEYFNKGKVTSSRILTDLQAALNESLKIADNESTKQLGYLHVKEDDLLDQYRFKMLEDKKVFADRVRKPEVDPKVAANKDGKDQKAAEIDGSVKTYLKQLSGMKKSNSKEFQRLENALLNKQFDQFGNFILEDDITEAMRQNRKRSDVIKEVKANLKEIAEAAKAYTDAKGSASRFTQSGKERWRFADEMRTFSETLYRKLEIIENERTEINRLKKLDDSEIYIRSNSNFYKTDSYQMTKDAFVKSGEIDGLNDVAFKNPLPGEKPEIKKEEIKEPELGDEDGLNL